MCGLHSPPRQARAAGSRGSPLDTASRQALGRPGRADLNQETPAGGSGRAYAPGGHISPSQGRDLPAASVPIDDTPAPDPHADHRRCTSVTHASRRHADQA